MEHEKFHLASRSFRWETTILQTFEWLRVFVVCLQKRCHFLRVVGGEGGYRGVREEHEAESHARAGRWSREKASPRLRLVIAFARLIITKRNDTFSTSYSSINFCQCEQFSCCFSFDIIYQYYYYEWHFVVKVIFPYSKVLIWVTQFGSMSVHFRKHLRNMGFNKIHEKNYSVPIG